MPTKPKFDFNPFKMAGIEKPVRGVEREDILDKVSQLVANEVKKSMREQRAVTGRGAAFKPLSKEYAAYKLKTFGNKKANLIATRELIDNIVCEPIKGGLRLTVDGDENEGKAIGHNHFAESKLPKRSFIPNANNDETFRAGIRDKIIDLVNREVKKLGK